MPVTMLGAKNHSQLIDGPNTQDKIVNMTLRYGDETLKSWKPLLNTIFVL